MTRDEILQAYQVENGVIVSPGKFEGETVYAPYFYEATMDGCAEELSFQEDGGGEYVALVSIHDEDREAFPEIANETCESGAPATYAGVIENELGFVAVRLLTDKLADAWRREYATVD